MEIWSDCPKCDQQNCEWIESFKEPQFEHVMTCGECGCKYKTKGWVIYEEEETEVVEEGKEGV